MHELRPRLAWYHPTEQRVQLDDPVAPLYRPVLHRVQDVEPAADEYIPDAHGVQIPSPVAEYWPAAQTESLRPNREPGGSGAGVGVGIDAVANDFDGT